MVDNNEKRLCCATNKDGNCTVCPGKCYWDGHKKVPYVIKYTEIEEVVTVLELKKKYYDNKSKLSLSDQIIQKKEL